MRNRNIRYTRPIPTLLIALVLACFSPSPAVRADDDHSIVGLWKVHYFHGTTEFFQSYDQWHRDGQEFEVANFFGGLCQGTWKRTPHDSVRLFHVGWNFEQSGQLIGYFEETQINTVSHDGHTYQGTFDIKNYDTSG